MSAHPANLDASTDPERDSSDLPKVERVNRPSMRRLPEAVVPHLTAQELINPRYNGAEPAPFDAGAEEADREEERNPIFDVLVHGENDVPGLLAYALYKQNKRDWLIAFQATNSRAPNADERASFILSERIPRRTATYRRLAEDMLSREDWRNTTAKSGLFSGMTGNAANDTAASPAFLPPASKRGQTLRYIAGMLILVIAMAILFRFAGGLLFGTPGR